MTSQFKINVIKAWKDKGRQWLKDLPIIVERVAREWKLINLTPVKNLSFNYVMVGNQAARPIVLKLGCDAREIGHEVNALEAYNGNGSVRLLGYSIENNALLLEQMIPGTSLVPLYPYHDNEALKNTVEVMKQLHAAPIPRNNELPQLQDIFKELFKPHSELDKYHIHKAQEIALHLFATQSKLVLLHGDLHHDNILQSERGLLAIDRKGVIGDPSYEVYAFIRNPYPDIIKPRKLILQRLELFAEYMSFDIERMRQWVYVRAVLEARWAIDDGHADPRTAWAEADEVDI
jgi:streptomycin 6-kinase